MDTGVSAQVTGHVSPGLLLSGPHLMVGNVGAIPLPLVLL